ncbi:hypothetical protein OG496_51765 [Streptomyces sp. NBC_00988]|uniref:hypothetical protein n=1 Tax=Streptomyces sp. NBC_00988 TaxID=2903704 RepID=UPI0038705871|nr:hypothetical protein OG496_51765 [Streptomyces sp. NBC_00988]
MEPAVDPAVVGLAMTPHLATASGTVTRAYDPFSLPPAAARSSRRGSHPSSHPDRNL